MITRRKTFRLLLAPFLAPLACLLSREAKAKPIIGVDPAKGKDRTAYVVVDKSGSVKIYPIVSIKVMAGFEWERKYFEGDSIEGTCVVRDKSLASNKKGIHEYDGQWREFLGWEHVNGKLWARAGYPIEMLKKGHRG